MRSPDAPDWFDDTILFPTSEEQRDTVRHVQRVMRLDDTGEMDSNTRAALRALQSLFNIKVTGVLDLATAQRVEQIRNRFA